MKIKYIGKKANQVKNEELHNYFRYIINTTQYTPNPLFYHFLPQMKQNIQPLAFVLQANYSENLHLKPEQITFENGEYQPNTRYNAFFFSDPLLIALHNNKKEQLQLTQNN